MTRFARILVIYDGSESARGALYAALDLADDLRSHVEVLTVGDPLPRYAGTLGEVDDALGRGEALFAEVLAEARWLAAARGVEIDASLRPGRTAEEIVRHATQTGAGLIVLGHRRRSLRYFPLRWGAAKVARLARCPVLVVP